MALAIEKEEHTISMAVLLILNGWNPFVITEAKK
jgi:hypothetical protein